MSSSLPIASFKLRFIAKHVRVVPAADARGCPFQGPGVDLFGEAAQEAFDLARPILGWIEALEPVKMRTLGLDLRKRRFLGTVENEGSRPRVLVIDERSDAAAVDALIRLAAPLVARLGELAADRIQARGVPDA
ncbi:MAG: hypothetical protein ACLQVI_38485 [Polyangiaceae bacterium]